MDLAAAVIVAVIVIPVAAAAATTKGAAPAAVAEQQDQNDDPPPVVPTAIVVTHNSYLQIDFSSFAAHSMVFRKTKNVRWRYRNPAARENFLQILRKPMTRMLFCDRIGETQPKLGDIYDRIA